MHDAGFDPDDILLPGQDAVCIFENDSGGVTVKQVGEGRHFVALNVDSARRVAAALLRIATRIEAEETRYAEVRERRIVEERIRRASYQ